MATVKPERFKSNLSSKNKESKFLQIFKPTLLIAKYYTNFLSNVIAKPIKSSPTNNSRFKKKTPQIKGGFNKIKWLISGKYTKIIPLSQHSILIENNSFNDSIKAAIKYFNVKNKENLIWKKVYYKKPSKKTEDMVDAYKFFYHKDKEEVIKYLVDQNLTNNYLQYQIKKTRDGIYIMFIEDIHHAQISRELIRKKLLSLKIPISNELINQCIESKRQWIKIDDSKESSDDGKIVITVSDDSLRCYINKTRAKDLGREIDTQDVREALHKSNILFGIIENKITEFAESTVYGKPVLIADAEKINPNFDNLYEKTYLSSPDMLDHPDKKKKLFFFIEKDSYILKRTTPLNKEVNYKNVFGKIFERKKIGHLVNSGENTFFDPDGNLISKSSGTLIIEENKYNVRKVLVFDSINSRTGNIVHNGSILVEKDIEDGVTVKVTGGIIIKGYMGASHIEANDNILITKGVNGANRAVITSHNGSVSSNYIRNSTVSCKKDLIIHGLLSGCYVWVDGNIITDEFKTTIQGGSYYVHKKIITHNLGSISAWKTYVHMGVPMKVIKKCDNLKGEIDILQNDNQRIKNLMKNSLMLKNQERENAVKQLETNHNKIKELKKNLESAMEERIYTSDDSRVIVRGALYPGVMVDFGGINWENQTIRYRLALLLEEEKKKNIVIRKI